MAKLLNKSFLTETSNITSSLKSFDIYICISQLVMITPYLLVSGFFHWPAGSIISSHLEDDGAVAPLEEHVDYESKYKEEAPSSSSFKSQRLASDGGVLGRRVSSSLPQDTSDAWDSRGARLLHMKLPMNVVIMQVMPLLERQLYIKKYS
ncbi:hypothetical protein NC652_034428 [Populus alba x Populus x berolinensis]|nr:hypothetical protein NC652_034428 [Populus alba x Populus x berolinensis]